MDISNVDLKAMSLTCSVGALVALEGSCDDMFAVHVSLDGALDKGRVWTEVAEEVLLTSMNRCNVLIEVCHKSGAVRTHRSRISVLFVTCFLVFFKFSGI